MANIRWTKESADWLERIHEYISDNNPSAAQKVVKGLYEKAQILQIFPQIGYLYRIEPEGEIRILLYGHYRIAYFLKQDAIEILGVFHCSMRIESYL
jgi:plasmid stabilization system protein ParE